MSFAIARLFDNVSLVKGGDFAARNRVRARFSTSFPRAIEQQPPNLQVDGHFGSCVTAQGEDLTKLAVQVPIGPF
ncbi:hypothetical protein KDA_73620 [Dictyobacter alpinus]|uniref:Uncharacterized protein n=1 Tax=Dictyobacter alpinus TaxID=2014873 RepID=A0A402BKI8_9CHLR|nr:hypothetical protein KDA_73620 [Dictyobacter alpinus]